MLSKRIKISYISRTVSTNGLNAMECVIELTIYDSKPHLTYFEKNIRLLVLFWQHLLSRSVTTVGRRYKPHPLWVSAFAVFIVFYTTIVMFRAKNILAQNTWEIFWKFAHVSDFQERTFPVWYGVIFISLARIWVFSSVCNH
jgi:hypothetical protein